jgi:hypothetical protein
VAAARTLNELLEVGGSEGGDSDGVLWPERRLVVAVGVPLQIPQVGGEHERQSHLASGGRRREEGGFGQGNGKLKGRVGSSFEMGSGRRQILDPDPPTSPLPVTTITRAL